MSYRVLGAYEQSTTWKVEKKNKLLLPFEKNRADLTQNGQYHTILRIFLGRFSPTFIKDDF